MSQQNQTLYVATLICISLIKTAGKCSHFLSFVCYPSSISSKIVFPCLIRNSLFNPNNFYRQTVLRVTHQGTRDSSCFFTNTVRIVETLRKHSKGSSRGLCLPDFILIVLIFFIVFMTFNPKRGDRTKERCTFFI